MSSALNMEEVKVKVAVVGDAKVGKSSLISSYLFGTFSEEYEETIGVDFFSKSAFLEALMVRMQIWDLSGHERFRELIPSYIRDAQAVIVAYDVSNRDSFTHTTQWVKIVRDATTPKAIVLVGTKTDSTSGRTVSAFEGESKAKELGCLFVEATPTNARSVTRVFLSVAEAVQDEHRKSNALLQAQPTSEHWIEIPLNHPTAATLAHSRGSEDNDCVSQLIHAFRAALKSIAAALRLA